MKNIKFIKEPGYTYDLFQLFILYFNKRCLQENPFGYNKKYGDDEEFNKILRDYLPISDDILLFFRLVDGKISFMTEFFFQPYKSNFPDGKYDLSVVLATLMNYDQVYVNLIKYYFKDIPDDVFDKSKGSLLVMNKMIQESKYSGEIKSALYSFYINPTPIIQKLSYELMEKEVILARQYEKNYMQIIEFQNKFEYDKLETKLKQTEKTINVEDFEDIYVTVCLNSKEHINMLFCDKTLILQCGTGFWDIIDLFLSYSEYPDLDEFGNAVSEKNRVEILNLMVKNGEVTIKDIESELGFTATNAYYHLSLMLKTEMLKTRTRGRTVLYSINKEYFKRLCDSLTKYSN
ncbi:MAG: winged helix-turn-helix transcriptional regulator [Lachnospiraceae bacterium]|nr:winged helix-turn-helix transcriptional regulator [Lachnospiraceae bacterium]